MVLIYRLNSLPFVNNNSETRNCIKFPAFYDHSATTVPAESQRENGKLNRQARGNDDKDKERKTTPPFQRRRKEINKPRDIPFIDREQKKTQRKAKVKLPWGTWYT